MNAYVCSYSFWFSYCRQKYSFQGSGNFHLLWDDVIPPGMLHMGITMTLNSTPISRPLEKWPLAHYILVWVTGHLFLTLIFNQRPHQWDFVGLMLTVLAEATGRHRVLAKNPRSCWIFVAMLCQNEVDMRNLYFGKVGVNVGIQKIPKRNKCSFFPLLPWRLPTALCNMCSTPAFQNWWTQMESQFGLTGYG